MSECVQELYLTIREPERAAEVLAYFEKPQAFPTLWKTPESTHGWMDG